MQLRAVEAVEGQVGGGVEAAQPPGQGDAEAGGGVHGDGDADQVHVGEDAGFRRLHREVEAADVVAGGAKGGRGSGQPEGLVAILVGGDEENARHGRSGTGAGGGYFLAGW